MNTGPEVILTLQKVLKNDLSVFHLQWAAGYSLLVYITNWMLGAFDPWSVFNCCGCLIVLSHPCNRSHRPLDVNIAGKAVKKLHPPNLIQPWTQCVVIYFSSDLKSHNSTAIKCDLIMGHKVLPGQDFSIHSLNLYLYRLVR